MQPKRKGQDNDKVTEAGIESFPASDPPAYNMPGRGSGDESPVRDRQARTRLRASEFVPIAIAIAAIILTAVVVWFALR